MRNILFILLAAVLLLVNPLTVWSQLLESDQIPGLKIEKETGYDGTSLYGYIDGGSTLYFEYGFDRLTVQEVVFQNEKFTIEDYLMKSCKGAFGVYSINTFQCGSVDQQGMISCENPYQFQLLTGHHYISVVNTTGTPAARSASALLAKKLKEIIPEEEGLALPDPIISQSGKITGEVKFINGELGLQNGLPDWSSCFEGLNNFELWMRQSQTDGKDYKKALVLFGSPVDLETFIHNASLVHSGDGWKSKEDQKEQWIVTRMSEKAVLVFIQ